MISPSVAASRALLINPATRPIRARGQYLAATERPSSDRPLPWILHGYWFPSLWPSFNEVSTADGSELSLPRKATTCQISWSVSNLPQAGIPVLRIPCLTIQKSSPSVYADGCTLNCGAGG